MKLFAPVRHIDFALLGVAGGFDCDFHQFSAGDGGSFCWIPGIGATCCDDFSLGLGIGGEDFEYRDEMLVTEIPGFASAYAADEAAGDAGLSGNLGVGQSAFIANALQSGAEKTHKKKFRLVCAVYAPATQLQHRTYQEFAPEGMWRTAKREKFASTFFLKIFLRAIALLFPLMREFACRFPSYSLSKKLFKKRAL